MEKSNLFTWGNHKFSFEKENLETGWIQFKTENGDAFWLPSEIFFELDVCSTYRKKLSEQNDKWSEILNNKVAELREINEDNLKKMRLAIDSQRKSKDYFKRERDETKQILTALSIDFDAYKTSSKLDLEFAKERSEEWKAKYFDHKEEAQIAVRECRKYIMLISSALGLALMALAFS